MTNAKPFSELPGKDVKRVLFICTHNSARSQMAEAWLNQLGSKAYEAESAGLEPGKLKASVITVMRESGIDISNKQTQSVFEIFKTGRRFDYVIALCDEDNAKRCPLFQDETKFLRWEIPERPKAVREAGEDLAHYRYVRDLIKDRVQTWMAEII